MKRFFIIFLAILSLSGCSSSLVKPMTDVANETKRQATQALNESMVLRSAVRHESRLWMPTHELLSLEQRPIEKMLTEPVVVNRTYITLGELIHTLTDATHTSIEVDSREQSKKIPSPDKSRIFPMAVNFQGTLREFLGHIASKMGMHWEIRASQIYFFRLKTKLFKIEALPGETLTQNDITSSAGASDASDNSSDQNATSRNQSLTKTQVSTQRLSIYQAIEKSLPTMISPEGSFTVMPATGTITVTDTPVVLDTIGQFIAEQNRALSQKIHLKIRVLSVSLNHSHHYGIDWQALYQSLSSNLGASLLSPVNTQPNAGTLTFSVLPGKNLSPWAGTKAIISALSEQGSVSNLTSATVTTLSNQPTPLQVGRQIAYLKSATTTLTDGSSVSSELNPGTINTGFSMSVLANALEKKRLLVQLSVDISSLVSLNQVQSGQSMIQTPEIETRNFLQRVHMNSGDTLMFAGFEQNLTNASLTGTTHAENVLFGGGVNAESDHQIIVILLHAVLGDTL